MKKSFVVFLSFVLLMGLITVCIGCEAVQPQAQDASTNPGLQSSQNNDQKEKKIDSGRYVGRIDNNSIEIKISGVPDEMAAQAYRLSDNIRDVFDNYQLQEGDPIKVEYQENEYGQKVITAIDKL